MKEESCLVARERLRMMIEKEQQLPDDDMMDAIRSDINDVISKYVDIEPENIEIKIILREYKKREQNA